MNGQIKSPYNIPAYVRKIELIPLRHVCGRLVWANLEGEGAIFYAEEDCYGECQSILSCPHCNYPLGMDWMRPLWYVEPMPYGMAVKSAAYRVCSNCWGPLEISRGIIPVHDDETGLTLDCRLLICRTCKYETRGYVTNYYTGRAREEDYLNYGRAIIGLAEALELEEGAIPVKLSKNQPVSAMLAEMGF